MSNSTRLTLPYLAAGQAQKHVTVNETLLRLDALVQLSALSESLAAQPASPSDGDIYILPAGKSGDAWDAMAEGALAYYRDGAWEELTPRRGWRCFVEDAEALLAFTADGWSRLAANDERRLLFTPGGEGVVSIYRIDTARVQNPRTAAIASIASDTITLSSPDAGLFFGATMAGVSYVRIWNTSKTPNESAWVKNAPAGDQLQVTDPAAVAGWTAAETVQIGDPTGVTPNRCIALDISPMMQAVLGRVFRQSGVLCKMLASGASAQTSVGLSEAGATGSFQNLRSFSDGALQENQNVIACSQLSPISNSNLVFLRETASGATMATAGASVMGLFV
jgi:hypothetical protein